MLSPSVSTKSLYSRMEETQIESSMEKSRVMEKPNNNNNNRNTTMKVSKLEELSKENLRLTQEN